MGKKISLDFKLPVRMIVKDFVADMFPDKLTEVRLIMMGGERIMDKDMWIEVWVEDEADG